MTGLRSARVTSSRRNSSSRTTTCRPIEISKYASSEFLAWVLAFSLGNVTVVGTGAPYTYTIVPAFGATNPTGLELPYFSFVQQIRPGGSAVLDEILVGCAIKGWKLSIKNSPGRASAMCSRRVRDHRAVHQRPAGSRCQRGDVRMSSTPAWSAR